MERPDLAGYAAKSAESRGRKHAEEFRDDRPAFDDQRIVELDIGTQRGLQVLSRSQ